ncbi:MAG TPA: methyltransferase domain-containing protein [Candidatus Dormibacteraeota bacterium]|jgi:SAM-dependent methyltransferase|nr:methyltransferase domain-containing protein [Candidatus Dormibacteraeota bacterium]
MVQEAAIQAGVARVFDEAAGYYRQMRWEKNRLTQFEKWLTQTTIEGELGDAQVSKALELGCGPGTWTGVLADRAERVRAVDLSEAMLAQATRALAERSNVELTQSDIARFDPGTETFDRILSVRVVEYVPEWQGVVESFGRWLAPGGRAVVVTKTPVSVWRGTGRERWFGPRTFARRLTGRSLNADFWQKYIPVKTMVRAFQTAGLVDIKVRPVIFGLPIFMRGTKQYPIVPPFAEQPFLWASKNAWQWVSAGSQLRRTAALPLAESYAVSGRRLT